MLSQVCLCFWFSLLNETADKQMIHIQGLIYELEIFQFFFKKLTRF